MRDDVIAELSAGLPPEAILTDPDVTAGYAHDMASFSEAGTPAVVVRPRTTEHVQHVMRTATALRVPVVPQGARTGLSGAANASDGCIVLSLAAMDRILEIDPVDRIAVVEPGVVNAVLSRAVGETGPVLPAGPVELGAVHDRRQHRHRRGRPVLREVRRHRRVRTRPRSRARRRTAADHRPPYRQGRRGIRPDPAVRGLRGHPRGRGEGGGGAAARTAAAARAGRGVPVHGRGLRGGVRDHGRRPRPVTAGADGRHHDPRGQRDGEHGPAGDHRGAAAGRLRHPGPGRRPGRARRAVHGRRRHRRRTGAGRRRVRDAAPGPAVVAARAGEGVDGHDDRRRVRTAGPARPTCSTGWPRSRRGSA